MRRRRIYSPVLRLGSVISLSLMVCAVLAACGTGLSSPTPSVDQSTPEVVVQGMYKAFNEKNVQLLRQLLDADDTSNKKALEAFEQQIASGMSWKIANIEMDVVENNGHVARIRSRFHQTVLLDGKVVGNGDSGDALTLTNKDGRWYFIGFGQPIPPGWVIE